SPTLFPYTTLFRSTVDPQEPWKAREHMIAAAGTPSAITAEYGSSTASVSVNAVVVNAMMVPKGKEPVKRCQTGTNKQQAMAIETKDHGWKASQPCNPKRSAIRPPSQNQPMG